MIGEIRMFRSLTAKAAATTTAAALLLTVGASAAFALDRDPVNVTMPVRGEIVDEDADTVTEAFGRDNFHGLVCAENASIGRKVRVRGVMDMANVWKEWDRLKAVSEGLLPGAFGEMAVTGTWQISAVAHDDIAISAEHFTLESFTAAYDAANGEFAKIMVPTALRIEDQKFIVDFKLRDGLKAKEIEGAKLNELSVVVPSGAYVVSNEKMRTNEDLNVTDLKVTGQFNAQATGVPIFGTVNQPINFTSEAAQPIIINRHADWVVSNSYEAMGAPQGVELPAELALADDARVVRYGTEEALMGSEGPVPAKTEVTVPEGTWMFKGWAAPEATKQDLCGKFVRVGTWEFTAKPADVDEPKGNDPQSTPQSSAPEKAPADAPKMTQPTAGKLAKTGAGLEASLALAAAALLSGGALAIARRRG